MISKNCGTNARDVNTVGIPEEKNKRKKQKKFDPIKTVNFPKLMAETKPWVQRTRRTSGRINVKREKSPCRCITFKLQIIKDK